MDLDLRRPRTEVVLTTKNLLEDKALEGEDGTFPLYAHANTTGTLNSVDNFSTVNRGITQPCYDHQGGYVYKGQ